MILTKEQIQRIDDALVQLGVQYIDIRMEMTDHIATAIEAMPGTFSQNFNGYMQLHKKALKDNYYRLLFKSKLRVFKLLFSTMVTLPNILITVAVYAALMASLKYAAPQDIAKTVRRVYTVPMALPFLYYLYSNFFMRRQLYSGLDSIIYGTCGVALLLIMPMNIIIKHLPNPWLLMLYYAVAAGFAVALLRTFITVKKQYTARYNG